MINYIIRGGTLWVRAIAACPGGPEFKSSGLMKTKAGLECCQHCVGRP